MKIISTYLRDDSFHDAYDSVSGDRQCLQRKEQVLPWLSLGADEGCRRGDI